HSYMRTALATRTSLHITFEKIDAVQMKKERPMITSTNQSQEFVDIAWL
ncbi:10227_t:CDS:1, partial [Gigaspora margarita]